MNFNPKQWFLNYVKKKKPISLFFDSLFIILIILLLLPATRTTVGSFFIRLTSLPPSVLDKNEQFTISNQSKNWNLFDLNGKAVQFAKLNEKPVFINIWATWCPPCVAELPGIHEVSEEFRDKVNFVLVTNEDSETVINFLKKKQLENLSVYYAENVPAEFSSNSIPATFIVDRNGKIVVRKIGAARWNTGTTRELLDQLIKE